MVRKICLDSDIIIGILNGDDETKSLVAPIDAFFVTTAINSFEILQGKTKTNLLFELFDWLTVIEFDNDSARIAAGMISDLKQKGEVLDIRDIFIAAVCIQSDVELLTFNKKHFERLNKYGLRLV